MFARCSTSQLRVSRYQSQDEIDGKPLKQTTLGGGALLIAGAFLGRETLVWGFNKALDAASVGITSGISFISLSWQNGAALALISVGLILVVWPKPKKPVLVPESYEHLLSGAASIINRVRAHRSAKWFERDRLEPTTDIARAGIAVLMTFQKAGFEVPRLQFQYAEQVSVGLEAYFAALIQMLAQGHYAEAKASSHAASQHAVTVAQNLNLNEWFFYPNL